MESDPKKVAHSIYQNIKESHSDITMDEVASIARFYVQLYKKLYKSDFEEEVFVETFMDELKKIWKM